MNIALELSQVLRSVLAAFVHILPWLALTIPASVWLKRSGMASKIEGRLKGRVGRAILIATLVGAVSPFCSCGVVPIVAALLTGGVPLSAVMSFWLASPSMDPEIFFLSVGTLGLKLALWRLGATFVMSLGAGFLTLWISRRGWLGKDILRASPASSTGAAPKAQTAGRARAFRPAAARQVALGPALALEGASSCSCGSQVSRPRTAGAGRTSPLASRLVGLDWAGIGRDSLGMLGRLSLFMGIAFLLEALITRYVPQNLVAARLGGSSPLAIPFATLLGIPFYTTELSALGIVAGLLAQGMAPAAALAFLIGGGVTTLPAMSAVWGIVRPRVFALYLGFCILGSLASGYAYMAVDWLAKALA